jgi:glycosidase
MRNHLTAVRLLAMLAMLAAASPATACVAQVSSRATAPDSSWVRHSAIYEVFVRDFSRSGDFRGVTRGLDRIQAVGANVVWLMPIYPVGIANRKGTLGSPYAVRDYLAVNPEFGTLADFKALVKAVHARGMKLTDWTDVAQLNYKNPEMRRAMIDAMRHWLVQFDIDGFRMDAAGFVPDDFWQEALPQLRASVKRPILLLAEWGDVKMHRFGFDLTYAWDSYSRLKAVWDSVPASRFVEQELADLKTIPPGGQRLRFTTNHDETAWDKPPVMRFGSVAGARAAFVAMALLPGRPLIYDGQEVESPQKLPLFERDPVVWDQPNASVALTFYRRIEQLIRTDPAFTSGNTLAVETSDPSDVIAYRRGAAIVLVNARPHEVKFTVTGVGVDGLRDQLTRRIQRGALVTLPAFGAVVLERN